MGKIIFLHVIFLKKRLKQICDVEHGYRFLALFSVILAKSGVFLAFSGHPAQPRKKIWAFFDRFGPPCRLLWRVWSIWAI